MDTYKTILEENSTQFTEKHSRFIGYVCHTETDEEAVAFIDRIRSLHSDARHNVYAYCLRKENRMRYSDDGEPHGTAGKPILDVINGLNLTDITVVVTRYFGGILLGTGGLVRAYQKSAKDTLESSEKFLMVPGTTLKIACEYSNFAKVETLINDFEGTVEETVFEDNVKVIFTVSSSRKDEFLKELVEAFASKISAEELTEKYAKQKNL